MTRCELLHAIQVADFAVVEANLFLDSHPRDTDALQYFDKYAKLLTELKEQYAEIYGPLEVCQYKGWDRWKWADEPFPWSAEANA